MKREGVKKNKILKFPDYPVSRIDSTFDCLYANSPEAVDRCRDRFEKARRVSNLRAKGDSCRETFFIERTHARDRTPHGSVGDGGRE